MNIKRIDDRFSVAEQISPADVPALAAAGFSSIICNRPDGEGPDQPSFAAIAAAARASGLQAEYLPVTSGSVSSEDARAFAGLLTKLSGPTLAYCRTGTRSTTLWSLSQGAAGSPLPDILMAAKTAGYNMNSVARAIASKGLVSTETIDGHAEVVIIGGGSAGIAIAASLKARQPDLDIAIIEPADVHYYQPGWTMVGAGIFDPATTVKTMASVIPPGARWIKAAVAAFEPQKNAVVLEGCRIITYKALVVAAGLKLDWAGVEGLPETLGRNGVTSNYRYDLAPYTWELVQSLKRGRAVFTQPPMPIKCAGAPQKALYLSADHWHRNDLLKDIDIDFFNAGAVLFGVKEYVPALMAYVVRYRAELHFQHTLIRVKGEEKRAWFSKETADGTKSVIETGFDMLHVVPPQVAPDFVRVSPLADAAGWVDVDQSTLRHKTLSRVFALGDVANTPNAKTAAAARKQAPIVAHNVLRDLGYRGERDAVYDGYGSCPLTVERGKIVLAEFGYGGKLLPSFPAWLLDGTKPTHLAWLLKKRILPPIYWGAMLRGREWMAKPELGA